MTANNPNLDLVSINGYITFGEIRSICSEDLERKLMCNNPNEDLVNMNAYIKFGEIMSICSKNIEGKRNFGVNQGPLLWYKCAKNDV